MKNGFYIAEQSHEVGITSNGEKIIITPDTIIILCDRSITQLFIPDGTKYVNCNNNQLTELIVPDQVEYINCKRNKLTELIVPDNCIFECDKSCRIIRRTMYNRSKRIKSILKQDN
jgi:hypothetical protein